MADISAIGSIGKDQAAAIKKINFQKCTPEEIKKYESEGQEVPVEIAKWAAEVAKIANAPDDVTYEMVNGEVDENQLAALSGEGPIEERKDQSEPDSLRSQYEAVQAQVVGQTDEATGLPFATADQKSTLEQLSAKMSGLQNSTTEKAVDFSAEIKGIEDITKLAPLSKDDARANEERDTSEQAEKETNRAAFGSILGNDKTKQTADIEPKTPEKAVEDTAKAEKEVSKLDKEVQNNTEQSKTGPKTSAKPEEKNDIAENDKLATDPNEILKRKQRRGLE